MDRHEERGRVAARCYLRGTNKLEIQRHIEEMTGLSSWVAKTIVEAIDHYEDMKGVDLPALARQTSDE